MVEKVKKRYWMRKKFRSFVKGFFHFLAMILFIVVSYQAHNRVVLITESYTIKSTIC